MFRLGCLSFFDCFVVVVVVVVCVVVVDFFIVIYLLCFIFFHAQIKHIEFEANSEKNIKYQSALLYFIPQLYFKRVQNIPQLYL